MEAVPDFPARAVPVLPAFGVCRRSWPLHALDRALLGAQTPAQRLSHPVNVDLSRYGTSAASAHRRSSVNDRHQPSTMPIRSSAKSCRIWARS
jgi:hypothetical protein